MLILETRHFFPAAPVPVGDPTEVVVSAELDALPVEGDVAVVAAAVLVYNRMLGVPAPVATVWRD